VAIEICVSVIGLPEVSGSAGTKWGWRVSVGGGCGVVGSGVGVDVRDGVIVGAIDGRRSTVGLELISTVAAPLKLSDEISGFKNVQLIIRMSTIKTGRNCFVINLFQKSKSG